MPHHLAKKNSDDNATVCAIIVTYNPDFEIFNKIIETTYQQVDKIIIVDNGSAHELLEKLKQHLSSYSGLSLNCLEQNVGIATAQNVGLKICNAQDYSHIVFLDHDSIPDANMVDNLLAAEHDLLSAGHNVGAVGPTSVDRRTNTPSGFVKKEKIFISRVFPDPTTGYVETDFLISSGTLVRQSVLERVGGMNDGYFIDHVDTEWCFRILNAGYRLFGSGRATLNHSLGENVVKVWCGRWREIPQHKSFRYYYIFRNTLKMIGHTPMSFSWKITHIYRLFLFLAFFSLVGSGRIERLKMITCGIHDGIKNKDGKMSVK